MKGRQHRSYLILSTLLLSPTHALRTRHRNSPDHPQLMLEGAFSHVPFDGTSYGFRSKSARYTIPDLNGENQGQSTWVDLAACCAATPSADTDNRPMDVDAKSEAFAPPLAARCLSYTEQNRGMTYKQDVDPKGLAKSPCAAQNMAFYHDLTRDDYHPRHSACCSWLKTFLNEAWNEFSDLPSKHLIDRVNNEEGSLSLYEKAKHLVDHYDQWSSKSCRRGSAATDPSCCVACMSTNVPNKLKKYSWAKSLDANQPTPDGDSNNLCSYFGDGWCGVNQGRRPFDHLDHLDPAQTAEHGLDMSQSNPSLMVDGAFKHRPTRNDSVYGGDLGHTYTTDASSSSTSITHDQDDGTPTGTVDTRIDSVHASVHVPLVPDAVPYVTGNGGPEIVIPDHTGGLASGKWAVLLVCVGVCWCVLVCVNVSWLRRGDGKWVLIDRALLFCFLL
jgi:hypothetical protein